MELVGYFLSILIGITLGLIGGGGSILTVPVLVYIFNEDAVTATSYSLFIVGITSLFGSLAYLKQGLVKIKTAVIFGIPSIITVFITRLYVVPALPTEIFKLGNFLVTKNILLMLVFALLMIAASYSMIKPLKEKSDLMIKKQSLNYPLIFIQGAMEGTLTGFVGAGGGFLIIPALVVLSKLPMKEAVGTSLVIISVKSLLGFYASSSVMQVEWRLILSVSAFAILGIFIGMQLSNKIDGAKLKPAFGWFVLLMGVYIILRESFF